MSIDASWFHVILTDNLATSGSYTSMPVFVGDKGNFGLGIAPVGAFDGEIYLEGANTRPDSDSIDNWFLVTDSFKTFSSEEVYYDVSDFGYSHVRVVIALTSGSITSGKVDVFLKRL